MAATPLPLSLTLVEAKFALRFDSGMCVSVRVLLGAGEAWTWGMNLPQSCPSRQICMNLWKTVVVKEAPPSAKPGGHHAVTGSSNAWQAAIAPGIGAGTGGNGGSGM